MHQSAILCLPVGTALNARREKGALANYGVSDADIAREAARLIAKILRGDKAGDLPVERPTRLDLTINVKTARALGLTIPPTFLARADEVIE
jgi:putative ABC transport system substrate-binding protein